MFDWIADLVANIHTRKGAYHLITGGILLLEGVFAYRIQAMYGALLESFGVGQATLPIPMTEWSLPIGAIGLFIIEVALFLAFLALGFAYATHRQYAIEALVRRINRIAKQEQLDPTQVRIQAEMKKAREDSDWMMWGLIANDIAAGIYIIIAGSKQLTLASLQTNISQDLLIGMAIVGWTVVVFLPFKAGPFTLALAESLLDEQKETFATRGTAALMDLQEKALNTVLKGKQKMEYDQALALVMHTGKFATGLDTTDINQEFQSRLKEVQLIFAGQETPAIPRARQEPSALAAASAPPAVGQRAANEPRPLQEHSNPAIPIELDAEALAGILHIPGAEAAALMKEQPTSIEEAAEYNNADGILVTSLKEAARVGSLRSQRQQQAAPVMTKESPDTMQRAMGILIMSPDISNDDLAVALNLKNPASAPYWRLQVQEFLKQQAAPAIPAPVVPAAPVAPMAGKGGHAAQSRPFRSTSQDAIDTAWAAVQETEAE